MFRKIIDYLYFFRDSEWHKINDLLVELFGDNQEEARKILVALCETHKRIEIKERRHLALTTHQNLTGNDPQNTQVDFDNWPLEARLTEEEKEKIDKEMETTPPKDYKYVLLKYLYQNGDDTINIRPFIEELIAEGKKSSVGFGDLLNKMSKTERLIWVSDVACLSIVRNSPYPPDYPIKARIESDGIAKYFELKNLYEPDTHKSPIHIGGDVTGSIVGHHPEVLDFRPIINPHTTPTTPAANEGKNTSIGKLIMKHIVAIVIGVVITLIAAYFIFRLGWNK